MSPRGGDRGFVDHVLDQLSGLDGVEARAMFGGHGLYRDAVFFGIVHGGCLYLRVSDATRDEYETLGMGPFQPGASPPMRGYYEVPPEVFESRARLAQWARRAAEGAAQPKATVPKSSSKPRSKPKRSRIRG